jgi:hypothetical protein
MTTTQTPSTIELDVVFAEHDSRRHDRDVAAYFTGWLLETFSREFVADYLTIVATDEPVGQHPSVTITASPSVLAILEAWYEFTMD